ncbi:glutathione S-transferase family protein [Inhella gelatinilytica]|uniref:Glutathione S-transferase n=1 Tax=Inhella gelatinilytica TaxID=2795030 RepID=A0A931N9E2_9BURK|nr:glutathione S-transferase [Inhella gelatinilytica]MBH9551268.1 glutathione S-transferase [Inhella gelatinilytica]
MHRLFGFQGAGSAAVEVALHWVGEPFENVAAASWAADSALEALREVNPLMQIPTLQWADGTVMSESAAILIELGLRYPASGLLPMAASERARVLRGLVFIAANCYSAISVSDYPERWLALPDEAAQANLRAGTRARLHAHWLVFADTFWDGDSAYLQGAQPGALDLLAGVVSKWSGTRSHLAVERPDFCALLQRVEQHPKVAPVFARHWAA